ncbi:transposase [Brenneria sp. 4F2]|nr:transposase [Brenneria bubanii]
MILEGTDKQRYIKRCESDKSVGRMAQELDIKENTRYNWKKRYQDKARAAFSNTPQLSEQ